MTHKIDNSYFAKYSDFVSSFLDAKSERNEFGIGEGNHFDPLAKNFFQIPISADYNLKNERVYLDLIVANRLFFSFELFYKYHQQLKISEQVFYDFALLRIIILVSRNYGGIKQNLNAYLGNLQNKLFTSEDGIIHQEFWEEISDKINDENAFYDALVKLINKLEKQKYEDFVDSDKVEQEVKDLDESGGNNEKNSDIAALKQRDIARRTQPDEASVNKQKIMDFEVDEKDFTSYLSEDNWEYKIYTKKYDEIIRAERLFVDNEQNNLWHELKDFLSEHRVSLTTNKIRLRDSFKKQRSFFRKTEYGKIKHGYLASILSGKNLDKVFVQKKKYKANEISCSILFDNSGSMHGRPIKYVADFIHSFAEILERERIPYEILGFTTKSWKGGKSKLAWQKAGKPENPGRLNEQRYIVYKDKFSNLATKKKNLALVCKVGFLKENIDGEALEWAYKRSLFSPAKKHYFLYLADGVPIDEATINNNANQEILNLHLQDVVNKIEAQRNCKLIVTGPHVITDINYSNFIPFSEYKNMKPKLIKEIREMLD